MFDQSDFQELDGFERLLAGRVELWAKDGIGVLVMNRPEKRNAIDSDQVEALERAVVLAVETEEVRAAVLTGSGRAFCAGGDIKMFMSIDCDNALEFTQRGHALTRLMEYGSKPFIAAVHGACIAGGLELALACDLVVAGNSATFGLAEVNLGLIPGWGGTVRIARAVPLRLARQLVLTCETLSASSAAQAGLVNSVVADERVLGQALDLASRIAAQPAPAIRAAREVINTSTSVDQLNALSLEASRSAGLFPTKEVRERVDAWVQGRNK